MAHVHDEAANAELAGRLLFESSEWISEVCEGHKLQNCIKKAFADNPALNNLVSSCQQLVGHFKHSALATDVLPKKQEQLKKRPFETRPGRGYTMEPLLPNVEQTTVSEGGAFVPV